MPTYQYECEACEHAFEALQSMTDKKLRKCPACGENKLYRLIGTGTGIIFKGSGFYETDYKKKASSKEEAPKGKEAQTAPPGQTKKTEASVPSAASPKNE